MKNNFTNDVNAPLMHLNRVSRFYSRDRAALFDISLNIYRGEFVYIFGPSGAGKSTLLRLLQGADTPDTGSVSYAGIDLTSLKPRAIAMIRRSMGIVMQDFGLVPDISVATNVSLSLEVAGLARKLIKSRVSEILECVGLSNRSDELAQNLSGGEQQRTAIARALVAKPSIILADEPTSNLDAYNADFALDLLERAASKGTTVVLATHDRMLMAARPHRTVAINRGRIIGMSSDGTESASLKKTHEASVDLMQTG